MEMKNPESLELDEFILPAYNSRLIVLRGRRETAC
jgi:hypothetical protein